VSKDTAFICTQIWLVGLHLKADSEQLLFVAFLAIFFVFYVLLSLRKERG